MVDLCQDVDLIVCKFTELRCMFKLLHAHHFHSEQLSSAAMLSSINISILTLTDALHQHVILYHFIHANQ